MVYSSILIPSLLPPSPQKQSGARVQVDTSGQQCSITITGPAASVQAAEEMLTSIVDAPVAVITCDDVNRLRDVIGPGGCIVKGTSSLLVSIGAIPWYMIVTS